MVVIAVVEEDKARKMRRIDRVILGNNFFMNPCQVNL